MQIRKILKTKPYTGAQIGADFGPPGHIYS